MNNQITALVVDDETILLDGQKLAGMDEVSSALGAALEREPDSVLVIESTSPDHYRGIGIVIYASQRIGVPVESVRLRMADGEVISFDELRARNSTPPV